MMALVVPHWNDNFEGLRIIFDDVTCTGSYMFYYHMPFCKISQDVKIAAINLYEKELLSLDDILDCC